MSFSPEVLEGLRNGLVSALMVGVCLLAVAYGARAAGASPGGGVALAPRETAHPFGVMLPPRLEATPRGMQVARELGVVYLRPAAVFVETWDGSCPACAAAQRAGLWLVLTVRNDGGGRRPTSPPTDLGRYQQVLGQILDRYRPAVLVVENEENSGLFYTGTPQQYGDELKAACQGAHERGIACTNGGLVSALVALLVYDHYREAGDEAAASDFLGRAFGPAQRRQLATPRAREQLAKGKQLLEVYKSAGVDYVNFHWYIADPRALGEAVTYLRKQTGLPVITNEVGQFTDDPRQTEAVMAKIVELGLPVAVWFAQDGPQARGLVNPDGTLRPTGEAFRRFIERRFGGR